jgi:hypothetical protein
MTSLPSSSGAIVSSFIVLTQTMQDTRDIRGLSSSFMEQPTGTGTVRSGLATKPPELPRAASYWRPREPEALRNRRKY